MKIDGDKAITPSVEKSAVTENSEDPEGIDAAVVIYVAVPSNVIYAIVSCVCTLCIFVVIGVLGHKLCRRGRGTDSGAQTEYQGIQFNEV